jgi:hypothetical protein
VFHVFIACVKETRFERFKIKVGTENKLFQSLAILIEEIAKNIYRYQYSETNMVHFLSARNVPSDVCAAHPEDEKVMLETCRDH